MTNSVSSALNIGPSRRPTSLAFTLALQGLEDVCQQIRDLEDLYDAKKADLLAERNEMIRDAALNRVAIKQLQIVSGLSRAWIYDLRARGNDD